MFVGYNNGQPPATKDSMNLRSVPHSTMKPQRRKIRQGTAKHPNFDPDSPRSGKRTRFGECDESKR